MKLVRDWLKIAKSQADKEEMPFLDIFDISISMGHRLREHVNKSPRPPLIGDPKLNDVYRRLSPTNPVTYSWRLFQSTIVLKTEDAFITTKWNKL